MLPQVARAQQLSRRVTSRLLGEIVRYEGDGGSHEMIAVPCRPKNLLDATTDSVVIRHIDLDWQFPADALTLCGRIATPKPGHKITAVTRQPQEVFEVLPIGQDDCWEPVEPRGEYIRVHTKRISTR